MNPDDVKQFLKDNIRAECTTYFGVHDVKFIESVTNNWFDDRNNYDGRWQVIRERAPKAGKILDMAAGCGTFVLYGLHTGYDVWGIEPESWKREYYRKKIEASGYPPSYGERVASAVGENLPFEDNSFDLVTTYQTLEHVQDVNSCIQEMLRVVKPGGVLYIKAPDYNSFYEPHYRVPFLPKINKRIAASYLKWLGKPVVGLEHLHWTTEKEIVACLAKSGHPLHIERTEDYQHGREKKKAQRKAQAFPDLFQVVYPTLSRIKRLMVRVAKVGREENTIDLWVEKIS